MVVPSDPVLNHCLIRNQQMKSSVAIIFICTSFDDARTALLATITPLKTATQQRFVLSSVGRTLLSAAFDFDFNLRGTNDRRARQEEELDYLEHDFSEVLALQQ